MSAAMAFNLAPDCMLARTSEGTRKMSSRATDLAPKLRSALLLVSGRHSFGDLLALAGGLAHVLEAQIRTLLDMGLIVVADRPRSAAVPSPEELPVAGAKVQLVKRLESVGCDVREAIDRIRAAQTLAEVAARAREAAIRVQQVLGRGPAEEFWARAREILIHWRDRAAQEAR